MSEYPIIGKLPIQLKMCKTCPWQTNGHAIELAPGRVEEIQDYLKKGQMHICHSLGPGGTTGKGKQHSCRGAVDYMASQGIHTESDRVQAIIKTLQAEKK